MCKDVCVGGGAERVAAQVEWMVLQSIRNGLNPSHGQLTTKLKVGGNFISVSQRRTGRPDLSSQKRHLSLGDTGSNYGHKWLIGLSLSSQTFLSLICLRAQITPCDECPWGRLAARDLRQNLPYGCLSKTFPNFLHLVPPRWRSPLGPGQRFPAPGRVP